MSKKWATPILFCTLIAVSGYSLVATAQIRPLTSAVQRKSLESPTEAPQQANPSQGPIRHQLPGATEKPSNKVQYNPVKLIRIGDQLLGAERDEGDISYFFENGQIVQEEVGLYGQAYGNYRYDRLGRFERIEYTDGMTITATYGDNNELLSLTSSSGLVVGFQYRSATGEALGPVTPTQRMLQFHSAIAVLRLQQLPIFLERPAQENIKDVSDETTPEGTPKKTIIIVGQRESDETWEPTGVDFIPIGGSGMGEQGSGGSDPIAVIRREAMIVMCAKNCSAS